MKHPHLSQLVQTRGNLWRLSAPLSESSLCQMMNETISLYDFSVVAISLILAPYAPLAFISYSRQNANQILITKWVPKE